MGFMGRRAFRRPFRGLKGPSKGQEKAPEEAGRPDLEPRLELFKQLGLSVKKVDERDSSIEDLTNLTAFFMCVFISFHRSFIMFHVFLHAYCHVVHAFPKTSIDSRPFFKAAVRAHQAILVPHRLGRPWKLLPTPAATQTAPDPPRKDRVEAQHHLIYIDLPCLFMYTVYSMFMLLHHPNTGLSVLASCCSSV